MVLNPIIHLLCEAAQANIQAYAVTEPIYKLLGVIK